MPVLVDVREYYEANFRRPIVFVDAHAGLAYAALGKTDELDAVTTVIEVLCLQFASEGE